MIIASPKHVMFSTYVSSVQLSVILGVAIIINNWWLNPIKLWYNPLRIINQPSSPKRSEWDGWFYCYLLILLFINNYIDCYFLISSIVQTSPGTAAAYGSAYSEDVSAFGRIEQLECRGPSRSFAFGELRWTSKHHCGCYHGVINKNMDMSGYSSSRFLPDGQSLVVNKHWLVVSTSLKNISQLGWLFPIQYMEK